VASRESAPAGRDGSHGLPGVAAAQARGRRLARQQSFLGVGLLVVVILLALLPVIADRWIVVVVPVVAMLTFAAARWLTTTYVEPGERVR
jgi:hypothetical protein